jgi:hypothetical protein
MAGVHCIMSKSKKPKAIRNSLFAHRDNGSPDGEESDMVTTLEEIAGQVKLEAAESRQMSEQREFFAQTHVLAGKAPKAAPAQTNNGAMAGQKKSVRHARLTADRYAELIENDLTVLEIISQVIDRNLAIRSQLKNSPV